MAAPKAWRIERQTNGGGEWFVVVDEQGYPRACGERAMCEAIMAGTLPAYVAARRRQFP